MADARPYKAWPLRTPFVAFIFIYVCVLIALLEYGRRNLPVLRERPPTPGEIIPAGNVPLTTATASFLGPDLHVPHPPSSQFQGIDVPAFSTARWGLSVLQAFTHAGPFQGMNGVQSILERQAWPGEEKRDVFEMGRCVKPVFTMSFSNNPNDCLALVEGSYVSKKLEYKVHLLDEECYSRAVEYEKMFTDYMTLTPECWLLENQLTTVLSNHKIEFPGKTVILTTDSAGQQQLAFANTSTNGGWPLNLNGGRGCWELVSTPFLPLPLPSSLTVYEMGGLRRLEMMNSYSSLWPDGAEKRIVQRYMTEDPGLVMPSYGKVYYPVDRDGHHVGCIQEVLVTSSDTSPWPTRTSAPAMTIPIFSTVSMPATSTSPSRVSDGPSIASSSLPAVDTSATGTRTRTQTKTQTTTSPLNSFPTPSPDPGPSVKPRSSETATSETEIQNTVTTKNHLISLLPTSIKTTRQPDETTRRTEELETTAQVESSNEEVPSAAPMLTLFGVSSRPHKGPGLGATQSGPLSRLTLGSESKLTNAHSTQQSLRDSSFSSQVMDRPTAASVSTASAESQPSSRSLSSRKGSLEQTQPAAGPPPAPVLQQSPTATRFLTRSNGVIIAIPPTSTSLPPLSSPPPPIVEPSIRRMTSTEYFIGLLGPVILCTILSVLIQAVTANLRSILPFAILSSPRRRESGIKASNSACLVLGGLKGPFTSIRLLWQLRELLPFLMDFLVLLSSVLTSISTSTVSLGYFGFCDTGSHDGWCYMGLGYYSLTLRVAEGILIAMAVSLIVVGVLLARLQTGVTASPWSVEHVVSLAVSIEGEGGKVRGLWDLLREMRKPRADEYIPQDAIVRHLEGYVFHLGSYEQGDGIEKYGILAYKRDKSSRLDTSGLEPSDDVGTYELGAIVTRDPGPADEDGHETVAAHPGCITPSVVSYNTGRTSERPLLWESRSRLARSSVDISSLHLPLERYISTTGQVPSHAPPLGLTRWVVQPEQEDTTQEPSRTQTSAVQDSPPSTPDLPTQTIKITDTSPPFEGQVTTESIYMSEAQSTVRGSVQSLERISYQPSMTTSTAPILPLHRTNSISSGSVSITQSSESHVSTQRQSVSDISLQYRDSTTPVSPTTTSSTPIPAPDAPASHSGSKYKKHNRISLHTLLQEIFLLVLTALLILITYYESVEIDPQQPGPPPSTAAAFERFMDSQSISVSTLFTSLAVAISLFWDYFFSRTVLLTTAASFASTKHQPGGVSKTPPPPPVTAFDGFTSSLRRVVLNRLLSPGHRQESNQQTQTQTAILLLLVSLAGILSKGIPILMAHIPFRRYQTWELHLLTGWMTVAVLAYMVLVLGGCLIGFAFFPLGLLNHPRDSTKDRKKRGLKGGLDRTCNNLPVMPDSLAGIMYMFYYYEYLVVDGIDGDTEI